MSDAMTAALIDAATKAEHDRAVRACALLVVDARVKLLGELAEKVAKLEPFGEATHDADWGWRDCRNAVLMLLRDAR